MQIAAVNRIAAAAEELAAAIADAKALSADLTERAAWNECGTPTFAALEVRYEAAGRRVQHLAAEVARHAAENKGY